jgi:hypothetical protein
MPTQSFAAGAVTPLQVAVSVPPGATVAGDPVSVTPLGVWVTVAVGVTVGPVTVNVAVVASGVTELLPA